MADRLGRAEALSLWRDVLVASVPLRTAQTLATRLGALPEYLLAGLAAAAALWSLLPYLRTRMGRRSRGDAVPNPAEPDHEKVTT